MPNEFEAALERLDFEFSDFGTMDEMVERLRVILDVDHVSPLQREIALAKSQRDFRQATFDAIDRGQRIDLFQRGGRIIFQLRDARGRFVAAGARGIKAHFDANPPSL